MPFCTIPRTCSLTLDLRRIRRNSPLLVRVVHWTLCLIGLQVMDVINFVFVGIGAIMVSMTIVTIFLIDRAGRRTLHLWGLGGMFIFSIFITISLLVKVGHSCTMCCVIETGDHINLRGI